MNPIDILTQSIENGSDFEDPDSENNKIRVLLWPQITEVCCNVAMKYDPTNHVGSTAAMKHSISWRIRAWLTNNGYPNCHICQGDITIKPTHYRGTEWWVTIMLTVEINYTLFDFELDCWAK